LIIGILSCFAVPRAAAQITVTSATPNSAAQGTVNLDVIVKGNGFKKGAKAQWFVSGTTNPGGVTVNSTAFNNSGQVTANITVAADAVISGYDIQVMNTDGRTGKGTELFAVNANGNSKASCSAPAPIYPVPNACLSTVSATGCLDGGFGTNGTVVAGAGNSSEPVAIRQQTDGKLVVIGQFNGSTAQSIEIIRYNSDGSLDSTFGTNGILEDFTFAGGTCCYGTFDGALDQNGNIVVLGQSPNGNFVRKYSSSGVPDAAFNANSANVFASGMSSKTLRLQPDGKLLISGGYHPSKSTFEAFVIRLNSDGTPDAGFGSGGLAVTTILQDSQAVAVQTVNSLPYILVAGAISTNSFALVRLTPSGIVDTTFGSKGLASTTYCASSKIYNLATDNTGNILAAGLVQLTVNGVQKIELARYTSVGVLDTTFGDPSNSSNGRTGLTVLDTFGYTNQPTSLMPVFDSSGALLHILMAGNGSELSGSAVNKYLFLARYNADGSLDPLYGMGGVSAVNFGNNNNYVMQLPADNLVIQSNGEYSITSGATTVSGGSYYFAVARYWP